MQFSTSFSMYSTCELFLRSIDAKDWLIGSVGLEELDKIVEISFFSSFGWMFELSNLNPTFAFVLFAAEFAIALVLKFKILITLGCWSARDYILIFPSEFRMKISPD